MRLLIVCCSAAFVALSTLAASGLAATHYIKHDGTGDFATIQDGVNASSAGDTVLLAAGIYTGVGNKDIDYLGKAITVTSESGPDVTIMDCEGLGRGFIFQSGEGSSSVVSGLTILNGNAPYSEGDGICCKAEWPTYKASPTITNNTFSGHPGRVIYCGGTHPADQVSPTITHNEFIGNAGVAIYSAWSYSVITHNTFTGKLSVETGIECYESSPNISNNTFNSNGFAINCYTNSKAVITDNTFSGNGTGIYCYEAMPTISNNTLSGNSAPYGGGIYCRSDIMMLQATIENNIIAFSIEGEGIYCGSGGTPTVTCCDMYGNAGGDALPPGVIDGGGNLSADPLFCDPGNDEYTLALNSPCTQDNHPLGVLVGAWPVGCEPIAVERATWGRMKAMYRVE
jgi:parallel beta-helix repeat protein